MKLPTVRLKNRKTGEIRIINRADYTRNLSKWLHWVNIGESDIGVTKEAVAHEAAEFAGEQKRFNTPGHISRKDPERRQAQRKIIVSTDVAAALRDQAKEAGK